MEIGCRIAMRTCLPLRGVGLRAILWVTVTLLGTSVLAAEPLDPRGKIHIPIGIANTLDTLKTFVEPEGCFSPGVGSYGVFFWVFDPDRRQLVAPTLEGVESDWGLDRRGYLIPWSRWQAGDVRITTEVCEVRRKLDARDLFVVAARATLENTADVPRKASLYVAIRPLGPAGFAIRAAAVGPEGDALLVDGHPAIVPNQPPDRSGVLPSDTVGRLAASGEAPQGREAASASGDCSGALVYDVTLPAKSARSFGFVCPVLPGRRAVGHRWDGKNPWAQLDEAELNPPEGGQLQPDPGLDYFRKLSADDLFEEAARYWDGLLGRATIETPDARWNEAFHAIAGHVAVAMNEGAPDVAVVSYNVFNRDGVYVANILQKSGQADLAREAIDYFLARPFNGRIYPEADNPGQILWVMGEHWRLVRDRAWLGRVHPSVKRLAAMIRYYRTTEGPHWVGMTGIEFGPSLAPDKRQELKPGRCDGSHPEYTEAFDIAGLRAAADLAQAAGETADAADWRQLAERLFAAYDQRFGSRLPDGYGSYCVLWPCRLYPTDRGKAFDQFRAVGRQNPGGWRYFALARAHQGLLTGNWSAGNATLDAHLEHEQMRGWYAFDEGGKSGAGGWRRVQTTWNPDVAMPHGWAVAEFWLLLRDCLLREEGDRVILLSGVPDAWLAGGKTIRCVNMPTYFGPCTFDWAPDAGGATLRLAAGCAPPGGFVLMTPASLGATCKADGKPVGPAAEGGFVVPADAREVRLQWQSGRRAP